MADYSPWLGPFLGLKPHLSKHDQSFNNVVFHTELILAKLELQNLTHEDIAIYLKHIQLTNTVDGLYAPKSSHDNLTAKFAGLLALESGHIKEVKYRKAQKGKHPRDWIFYGWLFSSNPLYWLLLPFTLLDIVRAIVDSGKVRPRFWDDWATFVFRVKVKLGFLKPYAEENIFGGRAKHFMYKGKSHRIIYVQNDGKIINLLRLNILRKHKIFRPFVRMCKKMYIKRMGPEFQSRLFANYFEEKNHPVRKAFAELEKAGKTIIDC